MRGKAKEKEKFIVNKRGMRGEERGMSRELKIERSVNKFQDVTIL